MNNKQKIAVVTGANRGLGFEASRQLAKKGYHVILTSRDVEKGKQATEKLQQEGLKVKYPGLESHPQHGIASKIMEGGFGTMVTFEVDGTIEQTKSVCESTKLFQLAVSLGAVESLIEQPATMSHASYDAADRNRFGIADGLIRLSIGLESVEDLKADLERAFAKSL